MSAFVLDQISFRGQQLALASGDNDDVAVTSSIVAIVTSHEGDRITGLIPFEEEYGAFVILGNLSANTITIPHDDAGSTDGYRFNFIGGTTFTMLPGQSGIFFRDPTIGWLAALPGTLS
jgi:hypothetical protein